MMGLEYADQRSYASTYGRFNTLTTRAPDRAILVVGKVTATRGATLSTLNRADPHGREDCDTAYALIEGCTGDAHYYCGFNAGGGCSGAPSSPVPGGSICNDDPTILRSPTPAAMRRATAALR
jgi:hypothetical protein